MSDKEEFEKFKRFRKRLDKEREEEEYNDYKRFVTGKPTRKELLTPLPEYPSIPSKIPHLEPKMSKQSNENPNDSDVEKIPIKTAALEVYKVHNKVRMMGVGSIVGLLVMFLVNVFNQVIGMGVAVIACVVLAFFLRSSITEMANLKQKYKLQ